MVAARRMLDTGLMSQTSFDKFYADYAERHLKMQKTARGNYWNNPSYHTSPTFGKAVAGTMMEGRLSYTAAYGLTDMHGSTFEKYAEKVPA